MKKMFLNGKERNLYKVNCHTHSTTSDGLFTPETIARLYNRTGYDAIFLTDHRQTNKISEIQTVIKEKYLANITVISGIELHPDGPLGKKWHILALGVPEGFPGEYSTGFEAAQAVRDVNGLVFAAHPYWCGITSKEILDELGPINGTEVFNASCRYIGREYNMNTWDELLDAGCRPGLALAVDDCHTPADFGIGWIMVAADELTPQGIIEGIRKGDFYSTEGPEFNRIEIKDGHFIAEFSPATTAVLISNRSCGRCQTSPKWPMPGNERGVVTSLDIDISDIPKGNYIRCQIKDAQGKMAWTMPYFL